jgi:hypothetical protein
MAYWGISRITTRPALVVALRYGLAVALVATVLGTALILWYYNSPPLIFYAIFSVLVGWFSASRRSAQQLLTEARNTLELRVAERTGELVRANDELRDTQAELRTREAYLAEAKEPSYGELRLEAYHRRDPLVRRNPPNLPGRPEQKCFE